MFLTMLRAVPALWQSYRLLIEAGLVLALVLGLYGWGHHAGEESGRASVQAKWDEAEKVRLAAEEKRKAENDEAALKSTAAYKAATAAITARHAHAASSLRNALAAPACPVAASAPDSPASAPLALGDVRISGRVVDVLRDAAGGSGVPTEPSTGSPGRTMLRGPGVPDSRS